MTTVNNQYDPWKETETDEETDAAASAPPVIAKKPDVAADPEIPSLVLPKPVLQKANPVKEAIQTLIAKADGPLPGNNIEARNLLIELRRAFAAGSTQDRAALSGRIKQVLNHVNSLEQSPKAPEIDLNAARVERFKALVSAEQRRQDEYARTADALKNAAPPVCNRSRPLMTGLAEFLECEPVQDQVKELVSALRQYKLQYIENFLYLSPRMRAEEHKLALNSNPSADTLEKICAEANVMDGAHFNTIAMAKVATLFNLYRENIAPKLEALLHDAIAFLNGEKETAKQIESDFFAQFGLPRQSTSVSERYNATIKDIEYRLQISKNTQPTPIFPGNHVSRLAHPDGTHLQSFFGIEL